MRPKSLGLNTVDHRFERLGGHFSCSWMEPPVGIEPTTPALPWPLASGLQRRNYLVSAYIWRSDVGVVRAMCAKRSKGAS
jgi:hypothetical protein